MTKKAKKIVQLGNPVLENKTEVISPDQIISSSTKEIIQDMLLVLEDHKATGAGLSANQIGYKKKIAICRRIDIEDRRKKDEKSKDEEPIWEIMINPELTFISKETSTEWEGCLSVNRGDLFGRVERPAAVTVEYVDENGEKKKLEASGYFSHVVQHELDHLNGILFLKYIKDPTELYTSDELVKRDL
jgi:peptide deformylase